MSGTIIRRKVDSRGRIVIPYRDVKEVLMAEVGNTIIISKSKDGLERIVKILSTIERMRKKEVIREWFDDVEKAGLDKLDESAIKRLISRGILRDLR